MWEDDGVCLLGGVEGSHGKSSRENNLLPADWSIKSASSNNSTSLEGMLAN